MENKSITISLPSMPSAALLNSYKNLKQKIQNLFILFFDAGVETGSSIKRSRFTFMSKATNGFKKNKKKLSKAIFPIILVVVLAGAALYATQSFTSNTSEVKDGAKIAIADAKKIKEINKTLTFPLLGEDNKKIGEFQFTVKNAEIRDEIIVKGQKANSVQGRTFVIVNMHFKNDLTQGLEINSRDYVRLSVNGNTKELLAPEIHNDPVEVQAISKKPTRVGFAIDDTDQKLVLFVGEINGKKERIELGF